ncbi:hypothetical protein GQ43DRAFT_70557 [Delitschia confertaspora ATCC 74209]|uniref:Mus7/MMS22 family-domain-containing protein n=1 Tax=Delitschia confertaspora ATCC 74209 TaxID=1513339 RepID=A0A9P4JP83_9PLEO|nr:hypothetical protein GQ43DRAFT_70557 [Delitschia confertaspora ATCC 74209]
MSLACTELLQNDPKLFPPLGHVSPPPISPTQSSSGRDSPFPSLNFTVEPKQSPAAKENVSIPSILDLPPISNLHTGRESVRLELSTRGGPCFPSAAPKVRSPVIQKELEFLDQNNLGEQSTQHIVGRSLRARNFRQLHPFLFDDAQHRRAFTEHGLKPIRIWPVSPKKTVAENEETQEKDFDPYSSDSSMQLFSQSPPVSSESQPGKRAKKPTTPGTSRLTLPSSGHLSHRQSGPKRPKLGHPPTPVSGSVNHHDINKVRVVIPSLSRNEQLPRTSVIYDVPVSPPYSSSPLSRPQKARPLNLLKNAASITLQDSPATTPTVDTGNHGSLDAGSDSDCTPRPPSGRKLRRPSRISPLVRSLSPVPTHSATSSDESDSEQIQQVKRRIKGVLPASWLRLDRQAQERRKKTFKDLSPPQPIRGVAQKVVRRGPRARSRSPGSPRSSDFIVISDDSDNDSRLHVEQNQDHNEGSAQLEARIPAFGAQEDSDTDLGGMENDRLHLFSLGGGNRKINKRRKRQSRVTDNFVHVAKKSTTDAGHRTSISSSRAATSIRKKADGQAAKRHQKLKKPVPRLSIIDSTEITSAHVKTVPQFIRLAMRQARRRPDKGRQSPRNKAVRLQTTVDTDDANASLQKWRAGSLLPAADSRGPKGELERRRPLTDYMNGQRRKHTTSSEDSNRIAVNQASRPRPQATESSRPKKTPRWSTAHNPPAYRTVQLEGLESDYNSNHRTLAFEKELSRVDHQFALQMAGSRSLRSLQLAKFLADEDAVPMPAPAMRAAESVSNESATNSLIRAPRRPRKRPARRIDSGLREYRQPSEPIVHDVLPRLSCELPQTDEGLILQGLGPFGTRYPTTFDILPLEIGTFFHSTTFISSGVLERCLNVGQKDLDAPSGFYHVTHDEVIERFGPWNDEVFSRITNWVQTVRRQLEPEELGDYHAEIREKTQKGLLNLSMVLRSLNTYVSTNLSFLDSIDRCGFSVRMKQLVETLFDSVTKAIGLLDPGKAPSQWNQQGTSALAHLMILAVQASRIADSPVVDAGTRGAWKTLTNTILRVVVKSHLRRYMPELRTFLEDNKSHRKREEGIQSPVVESLVVCMLVSQAYSKEKESFWDIVSDELSPQADTAIHISTFETIWSSIFILLPFAEFDSGGLLKVGRRFDLNNDNWNPIKLILNRLFTLYPETSKASTPSLNEYVRATLIRCHTLIKCWGWKRCDAALGIIFSFFARNGLKQLQHEESRGSPRFLENLGRDHSLEVEPEDSAFHIFLKCLALGLQGMRGLYPERKLRSVVWRYIPNHGRNYPKEESMNQEDLDALRNHHDILSTLYWASPPSCRPRLDAVKGLVQHQLSHREACRLSVRTWALLSKFQMSTDEPYSSAKPFALWHKEIVQQTLGQYRLAKTEAEAHFKAMQAEGWENISSGLLHQMIKENQHQVIATLQDSIVGMKKAIMHSKRPEVAKNFLIDSGMMQLLELYEMDDPRLTVIIRETLKVVKQYAILDVQSMAKGDSQQSNEESQDYGEWPDFDDLEDIDLGNPKDPTREKALEPKPDSTSLDFIRIPLWHLLSNAFGAERPPDDNLLMECVDAWVLLAIDQVSMKQRSWDHYIESYSPESWYQLRDTHQTRKFAAYFMSTIIESDSTAYQTHEEEFLTAWLLSLVERESMLKFQHRFTNAVVNNNSGHPLFHNLPFEQDSHGRISISPDTLCVRRLGLISSILANMREAVLASKSKESDRGVTKAKYAMMLRKFMNAMKKHYHELQQGASTVTGAYVEFVQMIVQFLNQHTSDICPVDTFFTDPKYFPLPTTDPLYVVGRLGGFASKLREPECAKELSFFLQNVARHAAVDNQQSYLVHQLCSALSGYESEASPDRPALRSVLFEQIFPAFIDVVFESTVGLVLSEPILEALKYILPFMYFDVSITDAKNVRSAVKGITAIMYTFVKNMEDIVIDPCLLAKPHILRGLRLVLEVVAEVMPFPSYLHERTGRAKSTAIFKKYFKQVVVLLAEVIHGLVPHEIPSFEGKAKPSSDLQKFTTQELRRTIGTEWDENGSVVYYRQGRERREVVVNVDTVEEERDRLAGVLGEVHRVLTGGNGDGYGGPGWAGREREGVMADVLV